METPPIIANAFWLTDVKKYGDRLRGLVRTGRCLVAPMLREGEGDWVVCVVNSKKDGTDTETTCVVKHTLSLSVSAQSLLESRLQSIFRTRRVTYCRFNMEEPTSHVVTLLEILMSRVHANPTKLQEISENSQCAHMTLTMH